MLRACRPLDNGGKVRIARLVTAAPCISKIVLILETVPDNCLTTWLNGHLELEVGDGSRIVRRNRWTR